MCPDIAFLLGEAQRQEGQFNAGEEKPFQANLSWLITILNSDKDQCINFPASSGMQHNHMTRVDQSLT